MPVYPRDLGSWLKLYQKLIKSRKSSAHSNWRATSPNHWGQRPAMESQDIEVGMLSTHVSVYIFSTGFVICIRSWAYSSFAPCTFFSLMELGGCFYSLLLHRERKKNRKKQEVYQLWKVVRDGPNLGSQTMVSPNESMGYGLGPLWFYLLQSKILFKKSNNKFLLDFLILYKYSRSLHQILDMGLHTCPHESSQLSFTLLIDICHQNGLLHALLIVLKLTIIGFCSQRP